MLHSHTEQNATGNNFNVTLASKLNDSPEKRDCSQSRANISFKLDIVTAR